MTVSQCDRVLNVLADGQLHPVPEIHDRAGTMRLNSRVAELRKRGHTIECVRVPGATGAAAYAYRLLDTTASAAVSHGVEDIGGPAIPERAQRARRPNPGDSGEQCTECGHPDYDHIGWDCLRLGCQCEGFSGGEDG